MYSENLPPAGYISNEPLANLLNRKDMTAYSMLSSKLLGDIYFVTLSLLGVNVDIGTAVPGEAPGMYSVIPK